MPGMLITSCTRRAGYFVKLVYAIQVANNMAFSAVDNMAFSEIKNMAVSVVDNVAFSAEKQVLFVKRCLST
jgi:hypothetical protein